MQRIGIGGYGEVVIAPSGCAAIKTVWEGFAHEADIHSCISHPNIVQLFGISLEDHTLTLELCAGTFESLGGRMSVQRTFRYFMQLLHALHYLHKSHIAHMDVKPANLLLSDWKVLKLCDFGAAQRMSATGCQYMPSAVTDKTAPPELCRVCFVDGVAVDIWSAGITLVFLLTGQYFWEDASFRHQAFGDWINKVPAGELVTALSKRSRKSVALVRDAVQYDPQHRPHATELLKKHFSDLLPV